MQFYFFSSKPFYSTSATGAVFLNCDFDLKTPGIQYFTKAGGQLAVIDCRFRNENGANTLSWSSYDNNSTCYYYNLSINGVPVRIVPTDRWKSVDLDDKILLSAYRLTDAGCVYYNTWNLLRGSDGWDPAGIKEKVSDLSRKYGLNFGSIPTTMYMECPVSVENGEHFKPIIEIFRAPEESGEYDACHIELTTDNSHLTIRADGTVVGNNETDESLEVILSATHISGLHSSVPITVSPEMFDEPSLTEIPKTTRYGNTLYVDYTFDLCGYSDASFVTWYRYEDKFSDNGIPVAVTRGEPLTKYRLKPGSHGYYVASVEPRHSRSRTGKPVDACYEYNVILSGNKDTYLMTDFSDMPTVYQPRIIDGFWTLDSYKPADTWQYDWTAESRDSWKYGEGIDGTKGIYGLLQSLRGARIMYTPAVGQYGDMSVLLSADPCKTAGQGFGSATGQYMDVFIKFDNRTMTGYSLRIRRSIKYDNAVEVLLISYNNGIAEEITEPVPFSGYRPGCLIKLTVCGTKFTATLANPSIRSTLNNIPHTVELTAEVYMNIFGGTGILHTGTTGPNATMLRRMDIFWDENSYESSSCISVKYCQNR